MCESFVHVQTDPRPAPSLPTRNPGQSMQLRRSGILVSRFLILMFVCAPLPRLTIALEPQPSKNETRVKPGVRSDGYGDPLPPGRLTRMGTVRDFIGEGSSRIIFSPGGQFVTASSAFISPKLRLWDPGERACRARVHGTLSPWTLAPGTLHSPRMESRSRPQTTRSYGSELPTQVT